MAPRRRAAEASYGCLAVLSYCLWWFQVPIDWGQSIYHADAQRRCLTCRAIVPNGSATTRSGGVLRLFGCFVLLFVVVSGSDRLGTIDLPCRRAAAVSYSVELSFTEADYFPMQKRLNKASSTSLLATVPATWPNSSSANRNSPATNSSPARSTHVCLA